MKYILILVLLSKISLNFAMDNDNHKFDGWRGFTITFTIDNSLDRRFESRCTKVFPGLLQHSERFKYDVRFYSLMGLIKKRLDIESERADFIIDPYKKSREFMKLFDTKLKDFKNAIVNSDDMDNIDIASIGTYALEQLDKFPKNDNKEQFETFCKYISKR